MSDGSLLVRGLETVRPFFAGGLAGCMATTIIQPIDTVKVRLQVAGEAQPGKVPSPFTVLRNVVAKEGVFALYSGLQAAWVRQLLYGATRLGLYRSMSNSLRQPGQDSLPFLHKALCGLTAGAVGAIMGNPADLALTRQQSDATLPPESRRNYKGVFDAVRRIAKEEGVLSLWKGVSPSVVRACAVTSGQLVTYDTAKETTAGMLGGGDKEAWPVRIFAACVSAAAASVMGLPVDMIKTRMMKQTPGPDGKLPYRNMLQCGALIVQREGPLALWTGLPTFFVRIAPHTVLSLLFMEAILKEYNSRLDTLRGPIHPATAVHT